MPLNKFNQHYLSSTSSDEIVSSIPTSSFYICQPSKYHSKCVLTIHGHKGDDGFYRLDNNTSKYKIPITGKVENIQCYPTNLNVLYKTESDNIEKILNSNIINKGDILQFYINSTSDELFVEFIIQCPLEKDK